MGTLNETEQKSADELEKLITAAAIEAKTPDELRRVKEAREALFAFRAGRLDYMHAARAVADLPITPAERDWPIGTFVVASSEEGKHYLTTAYRCTCQAWRSGRVGSQGCKHMRLVRRGEAMQKIESAEEFQRKTAQKMIDALRKRATEIRESNGNPSADDPAATELDAFADSFGEQVFAQTDPFAPIKR